MKSLQLRIFRFDKNQDYESYYKPYVYKLCEDFNTLYELLLRIQDDDIYFEFEKNPNTLIKLNRHILLLNSPIEKLVQDYGLEWIIEPLDTRRAFKDLLFDKGDFWEKWTLLSQYTDAEDKKDYEKLEHFYYASEILPHHPAFIGDALIYMAYKLIQKKPNHKQEILKFLADRERGIFYHLPTQNKELEEVVELLQKEIFQLGFFDKRLLRPKNPRPFNFNFGNIKHDFSGFNIACYGFEANNLKSHFKAKFINYGRAVENNGYILLNLNAQLAYKMASAILLDAYDMGADFMLVGNDEDFFIFDTCAKELMKSSGREFWDFYVLQFDEFKNLSEGIKPNSLQNHTLKVSLI